MSSDIWLVSTDHESFCVKRALPFLRVDAEWQAPVERNFFEAAWYRTVGTFMQESVPKLLYEDKQKTMFAMEYLTPDPYKNWKESLAEGAVSPETARSVGERLVRIHASTAGVDELMHRFSTDAIFQAIRIEPYLLATARAYPDLAARLQALAETTMSTKLALVHGDVSPKNILIGPAAPVFIDAECAWYGDPAFDLSFCLNHLLLKCTIVPEKIAELMDAFRKLSHAYLRGVTWRIQTASRSALLIFCPPYFWLASMESRRSNTSPTMVSESWYVTSPSAFSRRSPPTD